MSTDTSHFTNGSSRTPASQESTRPVTGGGDGQRVYELFVEALKLSGDERAAFLASACGDADERAVVEHLLTQDELAGSDGFLDAELADAARSVRDSRRTEDVLVGRRVGPYEIREWIASGGMGSVYRAVRINDFRQDVAIKFIRPGYEDAGRVRRFRIERQVLAELDHPHVARILDGGTVDDGRPYCVMEFIEGQPIDRYCDAAQLPVCERVKLFLRVCDAIDHAHRKGVIHLDLKPANILVDEAGNPKVVDFGIARLAGSGDLTLTHESSPALIGSLRYMSPEQLDGRRNVDARSDVYALGTILYRLLAGRLPFHIEGRSLAEAIQMVRECTPTRLGSIDTNLRGDLETIVAKAMEKDPDRRYASTAQFAADLERCLDGRPILARPVGPFGRLFRWYRRNRLVGLAVTTACFILIGATALSTWLAGERLSALKEAQQAAVDERDARQTAVAKQREAKRQENVAQQRAERLRRITFNTQLGRIQQICDSRPALALEWLNDAERCPPDLRRFAWHHLRRRCLRERVLIRTRSRVPLVPEMTFSPNGRQLASLEPMRFRIWDTSSGAARCERQGGAAHVNFVEYSPDGQRIVTTYRDNAIRVYSAKSAMPVALLTEHTSKPYCAAFSSDGTLLATGDVGGTILLWSVRDLKRISKLHAHQGGVNCLAFGPDGNTLVSYGRAERRIKHWSVPSGEMRTAVALPLTRRHYPVLSPDGRLLAVSRVSGVIELFQTSNSRAIATLSGNGTGTPYITFSRDGRHLAAAIDTKRKSGGQYKRIRIWDCTTRQVRLTWPASAVRSVALSSDGTQLAATLFADGRTGISLWSTARRVGVATLDRTSGPSLRAVAWLAGDRLLSGSTNGKLVLVALGTGRSRRMIAELQAPIRSVACSPDGRFIVAAAGGVVHAWDVGRNMQHRKLLHHNRRILSVAFCPDGRTLAAGARGGGLFTWKAGTWKLKWTAIGSGAISALAFSPDGKILAAGGSDRIVTLWDTSTNKVLASLRGHKGFVTTVAFSPDGRRIASASRDRTIRFWDRAGRNMATLRGHGDTVSSVAFSPDGSTLASGSHDATVRIWDVETVTEQLILTGHRRGIASIAFSPSGRSLATGSRDGLTKIWQTSEHCCRRGP